MGRRKWKLYQDALIPKRGEAELSSDEESVQTDPPPALKIKTIEQINEDETKEERVEEKVARRPETILESLIKRPATQPKLEVAEEPADWKPQDKCYFCTDGEPGGGENRPTGAMSPASESDSSSVSGAKSPASAPPLLQHLLQLQLQAQNPQTIAQGYTDMCVQFQQMLTALAALGSGLVPPPPLSQPWMMQRLVHRQTDRPPEVGEKAPASSSPNLAEQPLDLSAKSTSSTSGTPPPDNKHLDNRLKRPAPDGASNSSGRRAYTEDELQSAVRDIQSGRLGTRRAALIYGIPRSTLRNKLNKFGTPVDQVDSDNDSDAERPDSPPSVILKIPTFPPPDDKSPSPAGQIQAPITPITPMLPTAQPSLKAPSQLLLPPSVFADPPSTQHLFTSLSDVIAKSISQKFQQPLDRPHHQPSDLMYPRGPDRHVSVIKTPPDNQRYAAPGNSKATPNNNGQPATGGKGTRPKRGKYRNYDRDSLVEAVKAVQRGEMSVHRAGSYYGVPHSTLEYKVKERHLMRPRKREPKPPQDTAKPQPPKPPPPKPPTKPFSNGLNGPEAPGYPPGYPYWPGTGFPPPPAPDLYASHMMRRLREEAPPPANGSFLEGIIRSSLERPALLQRLAAPPGGEAVRRAPTSDGDEPPARRPRLDSSDQALAAEMREAVQRLRADKLRPRNGTPTPPPAPPAEPPPPPAAPRTAPSALDAPISSVFVIIICKVHSAGRPARSPTHASAIRPAEVCRPRLASPVYTVVVTIT
ncbi:mushroom body large-type Kenyon cell-specific protein 1 isoform X4 [Spodoptera frugiperda]|nr:mushroom body large-type Kenyon cell-specific protein 1 isoform X4 [Spodoptera frugiperda]XP_050553905.1 mushroom body large-type Kenyon cell-specific protein 1 isoform X4 [Spodoptera frugiperda]